MDKQLYRENRNKGLRGQGIITKPKLIPKTKDSYPMQGQHLIRRGMKVTIGNRKEARTRILDRSFTHKTRKKER